MKNAAFVKITNGQARAYDADGNHMGTVGRSFETVNANMNPNGDISIGQKDGSVRVYDNKSLTEKFRILR